MNAGEAQQMRTRTRGRAISRLIEENRERFDALVAEERQREGDTVRVGIEFVHRDHLVRLVVPLKPPSPQELNNKIRAARSKTPEQVKQAMEDQEAKRVWRVLFHSLKARLVSIDSGLETFEQAFLPHIVDPATDHTIWERIAPRVEAGALRIGGVGLALPAASESPKSARVVDIRPSEGGR